MHLTAVAAHINSTMPRSNIAKQSDVGFGDGQTPGLLIRPDKVALADWRTGRCSNQKRAQLRPSRPVAGKGAASSYQLRQYAEATLGGGSLRKIVKLPEGEDENEWLAVNSGWTSLFVDKP